MVIRLNPVYEDSDRLYRNNGEGTFTEVTREAGLMTYCFTLGIMSGDLNHDGLTDLYISADHDEPDYYFINNDLLPDNKKK